MTALVPCPPEDAIPYLDRPQRLGFLPTLAFWNRRDVGKAAGPLLGPFVFLWMIVLSVLVFDYTPLWLSGLLGGLGPYLFMGLLERYLRARLKRRRACLTAERRAGETASDR